MSDIANLQRRIAQVRIANVIVGTIVAIAFAGMSAWQYHLGNMEASALWMIASVLSGKSQGGRHAD